jgi:hypothetical protein
MKFLFQVEDVVTMMHLMIIDGEWRFERNWIPQSIEDSEFMNWMAYTIYPVIDGQSNWEPSADMYPYDYQY